MALQHVVVEGDGISSIAERYGLNPQTQTIWDDPANADLRSARPDPNVLLPDDVVVIPDKVVGSFSAATGKRHVFRRLGVPALFELQLLDAAGQPRTGLAYTLDVAGSRKSGTTDASGFVRQWVPCSSRSGRLVVGSGKEAETYEVELGFLRPISDIGGVQQRLRNLGFLCPDSGTLDDGTRAAIARFQQWAGVPESGELDDATRSALARLHDTPGTAAASAD